MPDMLVKLYELTDYSNLIKGLEEDGIIIRKVLPPEKHIVVDWVINNFNQRWASECEVAINSKPVRCYIAVRDQEILGFACFDTTCKDYFGPTGVAESARGRGIGKALLLHSLTALKEMGYAYAIIGGAGPVGYYKKVCGAVAIEDSSPGIYKGMLKEQE
ncbi:MAG: GNAT family N-acetyltransferase [Halanaerobiales bacterium]